MPRGNLLVADDVGLGKTIEPGLAVQRMLLRKRARPWRGVPGPADGKWRDELLEKFGPPATPRRPSADRHRSRHLRDPAPHLPPTSFTAEPLRLGGRTRPAAGRTEPDGHR
jgi:hypothetical protein